MWSPTGPTNPWRTHRLRGEAQRVAAPMATKNAGQEFYVCEATGRYATVQVTHTDLRHEQRQVADLARLTAAEAAHGSRLTQTAASAPSATSPSDRFAASMDAASPAPPSTSTLLR